MAIVTNKLGYGSRFFLTVGGYSKYSHFASFPHNRIPYTYVLQPAFDPNDNQLKTIPAYRILSPEHINCNVPEGLTQEIASKILKTMLTNRCLEEILYSLQRQGRIPFYLTSFGEEGSVVGSAAALKDNDPIFMQYREQGAVLYRGYTIQNILDQVFANCDDIGRGRQMPMHYGSPFFHINVISSPVATQLPHAVGAAYSLKLTGKSNWPKLNLENVVACFFGDGSASEGDFHAAMNFASTCNCPVLFLCRNNGYAISTPLTDQYRGDGIAARGCGYGMKTFRVDGTDTLAVFHVCTVARAYAIENSSPVLIELISYRIGHHSTSDDSTVYRSKDEIEMWKSKENDPIAKFFNWYNTLFESFDMETFQSSAKKEIIQRIKIAETKKKPKIDYLFTDVYDKLTPLLELQKKELMEFLQEYPNAMDLSLYLG